MLRIGLFKKKTKRASPDAEDQGTAGQRGVVRQPRTQSRLRAFWHIADLKPLGSPDFPTGLSAAAVDRWAFISESTGTAGAWTWAAI